MIINYFWHYRCKIRLFSFANSWPPSGGAVPRLLRNESKNIRTAKKNVKVAFALKGFFYRIATLVRCLALFSFSPTKLGLFTKSLFRFFPIFFSINDAFRRMTGRVAVMRLIFFRYSYNALLALKHLINDLAKGNSSQFYFLEKAIHKLNFPKLQTMYT